MGELFGGVEGHTLNLGLEVLGLLWVLPGLEHQSVMLSHYSLVVFLFDDPYLLSVLPLAVLLLLVIVQHPVALLLAVLPPALEPLARDPLEHPEPHLLVLLVEPLIRLPVAEPEQPVTLHQVVGELAIVGSAIRPFLSPLYIHINIRNNNDYHSMYHVSLPLSHIRRRIRPFLHPDPALLSKLKVSLEGAPILPPLIPLPMLQIIIPAASINSPRINTLIDPLPTSLVPHPLTLIDITDCVGEFPYPIGMIVLPITFIGSTISPLHDAVPISESSFPLPNVYGSIALILIFIVFSLLVFHIKFILPNGFPELWLSKILPLGLYY